MKTENQKQTLNDENPAPALPSGIIYRLKGSALGLIPPDLVANNTISERKFRTVKELEDVILKNIKTLFGERAFLISGRTNDDVFENGTPPIRFLLDLADLPKPRFYILDINLEKQNTLGTLLPKLAKYISGLKQEQVISKICTLISGSKEVVKEILKKMKQAEIPGYLKSAVAKPTTLLLMDSDMRNLPDVMSTFAGAWQSVKPIILRKFASNGYTLFTMHPSFAELHNTGRRVKEGPFTEEYHLEDATDEVKEIYNRVKTELLKVNKQLQFNSQKYYISLKNGRSIAFFHISRKRINLVVKHPEKDTRKLIKHHEIKTLTESVQRFWNGPSCTIVIESVKHLQEVVALLKRLVKS